jgi:hypothetical protein
MHVALPEAVHGQKKAHGLAGRAFQASRPPDGALIAWGKRMIKARMGDIGLMMLQNFPDARNFSVVCSAARVATSG